MEAEGDRKRKDKISCVGSDGIMNISKKEESTMKRFGKILKMALVIIMVFPMIGVYKHHLLLFLMVMCLQLVKISQALRKVQTAL